MVCGCPGNGRIRAYNLNRAGHTGDLLQREANSQGGSHPDPSRFQFVLVRNAPIADLQGIKLGLAEVPVL
jgi:hypothetical protein